MKWIEILNIVEKIANIILPICVLGILYVASREQISIWRGVKTVDCKLLFSKKGFPGPSSPTPSFIIMVKNKGMSSQTITMIRNDKNEDIIYFVNQAKQTGGMILDPGEGRIIPLSINQSLLQKFKNSKNLFLYNIMGKKKKIASKKYIQNLLQEAKK